jgi:hypothetical protein
MCRICFRNEHDIVKNYFTCSCRPRASDMGLSSVRYTRCFMTLCQTRSLLLTTGAVRIAVMLCLAPRGTENPCTSKSKSDLKKNKMLLFREHVGSRTSSVKLLYYIKNQQDATLAVLFISNCKITLHVSDAFCVHHQ